MRIGAQPHFKEALKDIFRLMLLDCFQQLSKINQRFLNRFGRTIGSALISMKASDWSYGLRDAPIAAAAGATGVALAAAYLSSSVTL